MHQAPGTDVFISYHAHDAEAVRAFAVALQVHSISASFDPPQDDIEDIRRRTRFALGRAKAFIAWNSTRYAQQRGLQWEFMSAFAAASRRGEERQRIFLVNPEDPASTSIPAAISARCRVESASSSVVPTEDTVAARVASHVATLRGSVGGDINIAPLWLPYAMKGFERFVGRTPELWRIHDYFTTTRCQSEAPRTLQLIGSAGTGKSGLAQEYALRFAALYPGGIFWLDAGSLKAHSSTELQAAREHNWSEVAARLGLKVTDRSFADVAEALRGHLDERGLPFLWVVDHAPQGLPPETLGAWLAPHPLGDSILICRSGEYSQLGPQIQIEALRADEARLLLTSRKDAPEPPANGVPQLIQQLTAHPLAMDLAGARLRGSTCEGLSWHVTSPPANAMKLAQDLEKQCPSPYRNSIAVMLHRGIGHLESQARNCLRISAVLADAPIPVALTTTALAQGRGGAVGNLSEAVDAIDELIDAALATRVNEEYFCVSPLVRCAVLSHEGEEELSAARDIAATTLASELTQAPDASYENPYLRWIPHALHISETAAVGNQAISNQVVEIAAWVARFETLGALRTGNRRALTSLREGNVERAQQLLDMEYTATRRGLGEDHPATITSVNNLGAVLSMRGELIAARSLFEHAVEVRGKVLGEQHPDTLTPLNNLAAILWSEADLEGAQALFECVVEHRIRWLGENHLETLIAMKNLAVTLRQQGDLAGARSLLERVVKGRQEILGPHHRDTRAAMASLARVLNEESTDLLTRATEKTAPGGLRPGTERSLASVYLG